MSTRPVIVGRNMAISMRTTQARAGQSPWLLLLLLLTLASSTPAASAPASILPALALTRNAVGASAGTGITALESLECGPGPTALNASTPNVLIIGDAISSGPSSTPTDPTGGYGGNVATILGGPFAQFYTKSLAGGLATVQHLGSADTGSVQAAACISTWLGGLRWDLVVVNVGLVDCTGVPLDVDQYQENVMKVMRAAWAAGGNAIFVATTPTSNSTPGVNHTCIKHANTAANSVVEQILNGGSPHISFLDLYAGVTAFCGSNYSSCPIQLDATPSFATTWTAPWPVSASGAPLQSMPRPSGQQFTALLVAQAIQRAVPVAKIQPPVNTSVDPPPRHAPTSLLGDGETSGGSPCGLPPAPLNTSIPNMLIIGDSVSDSGSGYGPLVRQLLEQVPNIPGVYGHVGPHYAGPLAIVQHNGGWAPAPGSNEQASSSANGVKCIAEWLGNPANFKWDVISVNFGIHDCWSPQFVNATAYRANLETIYAAITQQLTPTGKMVWTSTTPIAADCKAQVPHATDCYNVPPACVVAYNTIAGEVFGGKPNVVFNDVYNAVNLVCGRNFSTCALQHHNDVHPSGPGRQFLAVELAATVAPILGDAWRK